MAYKWQHVLSSRPTRRTHVADNSSVYGGIKGCIKYEFPERDENGILAVRETHYVSSDSVKQGLSGPPL
jgi:hypothetical protein